MFIRCRSDNMPLHIFGGLGKCQGSFKEEQYFMKQNRELLGKWRDEMQNEKGEVAHADAGADAAVIERKASATDSSVASPDHMGGDEVEEPVKPMGITTPTWNKLKEKSKEKMNRSVLSQTCFLTKQKNCREELYFYDEVLINKYCLILILISFSLFFYY